MQFVVTQTINFFVNVLAGLSNMMGALIVGALVAIWWVIAWHRRQRKEGKAGVQAWHLILVGAGSVSVGAIALVIGLAWQHFSGEPLVLASGGSTERPSAPSPGAPSPPQDLATKTPPPQGILLRKFSQKEAQLLIDAVAELTDAVRSFDEVMKIINGLYDDGGSIYQGKPYPTPKIMKDGIPATISTLREFQKQAKAFPPKIMAIVAKYPDYWNDIDAVFGQHELAKLRSVLDSVADNFIGSLNDLDAIKEPVPRTAMAMIILPATNAFSSKIMWVVRWKNTFLHERAPAARKELSVFLPG